MKGSLLLIDLQYSLFVKSAAKIKVKVSRLPPILEAASFQFFRMYLGSSQGGVGVCRKHCFLKRKISAAFAQLPTDCTSKRISVKAKLRILESNVEPVLFSGSKSWVLMADETVKN